MASTITRLEYERKKRKLTYAALGELLGGLHNQTARKYCLPPTHADYRWPKKSAADAMKAAFANEIHAGNFDDLENEDGVSFSDLLARGQAQ